jgi:L-aspartate oxidase
MAQRKRSRRSTDYLMTECAVVGGGLAGCTVALELADSGKQVDLFVKGHLIRGSNSYLIAGGLASVPLVHGKPLSGDSFNLHVKETLSAGKGLNNVSTVKYCVKHFFPDVIEWLVQKGVTFDAKKTGYPYHLHREGGHSRNRIFHVQDKTGDSIMSTLVAMVATHPKIRLHEEHVAIDLITKRKITHKKGKDVCLGLYIYDIQRAQVRTVVCDGVFLATGGLGKAFMYTSNADVSTGDGFAMCHRAGLPLVNMEFVQFHPSVFYDKTAAQESERRFLMTEALRGAGAILKLRKNDSEDLMLKYDPQGSMATRDIVARAEDIEMRKHGLQYLWLDCTRIPKKKILRDFRASYEYCKGKGFDMTNEPIPIVYAVHYSTGGVLVGLNGETSLPGCYVLGETAYSGLHGATRLASNSGPECVLLGRLAAKHFVSSSRPKNGIPKVPSWDPGSAKELRDRTTVAYYWDTVRRTMTGLCGVSRNQERLEAAREVLLSIRKNIHDFYWSYKVSKDFLEVRNIADVALMIVQSALARKESRACHFREDFNRRNDLKYRRLTILQPDETVVFKSTSTHP